MGDCNRRNGCKQLEAFMEQSNLPYLLSEGRKEILLALAAPSADSEALHRRLADQYLGMVIRELRRPAPHAVRQDC